MCALRLDVDVFTERFSKFYSFWEDTSGILSDLDAHILLAGKIDGVYGKTLSLHVDKDKSCIEKLIDELTRNNVKKIGNLPKDKFSSELTESFQQEIKKQNFVFEDISTTISNMLASKDENEIELMKKASEVTSTLFTKHLKEHIMDIIDSDKRVKHEKLSSGCQNALRNPNFSAGADIEALDMCYDPIIQSGGKYNLKFSIESNDKFLHFGTVVCSLGIRYQSYCSNVIRSLMVNPTEEQSNNYLYLHDLFDWAIARIKPDLKVSDFCTSIIKKVQSEKPKLVDKLIKSFGFVTGIEFRDSNLLLSTKSDFTFTKNMTLNFNLGFQNLTNSSGKSEAERVYSLWIGDIVGVGVGENDTNMVFTLIAKRRPKSISLYIKEDEEEEEDDDGNEEDEDDDVTTDLTNGRTHSRSTKDSAGGAASVLNGDSKRAIIGRGHRRAIIDQKTRSEQSTEEKRMQRRRELFQSLLTRSTNRLTGLKSDANLDTKTKSSVSYKGSGQMPKEDDVRKLRLFVDKKYETIILPIFGLPTPFHISTIKNVSTSIEADYTYLRINFHHPGAVIGVKDSANFQLPEATYVKEMTYRASNQRRHGEVSIPSTNLNNVYRMIKEVLKRFRSREAEEKERANLVEQDDLIVDHAKGAFRLKDLYIRPNITSKRITGTLEAHTNGFRFTSIRGDQIDILYNNIKHAFYQPCDGEMIIILHFHLKNAIMYGKKKQLDVQFYTEVGELTTDLSKAHSRMQDRDDLELEQRERQMREQIKLAFRAFVDKSEALARRYDLEFETPFRDLGFHGCPHRSTVLLMPTSSCVISITELPAFVITLDEVEFVMLERVGLSIRTFDMVFVLKDYQKKVAMINSIPSTALELVKEWLLSCDIYYAEASKSLNWPKLIKTVLDDPVGFIEQGGWEFVSPEEDGDSADEDTDDGDEIYVPSDSNLSGNGDEEDGSGEEYSSEEEDSDWDAEESEEPESLDSDESEGKDWDELEEEAKREDAKAELVIEIPPSKKRPHARDSPPARKKSRHMPEHNKKRRR